jgi:prepilin-type N-terminal cleavage/methylation domain-containing protein
MPGVGSRRNSAFTLIELVISAALMSMILGAAYVCLSGGISSQKHIESRSDAVQSARAALALMAADLRSAVPLSKEFEFIGMHRDVEGADADNLDFATRNYTPRHEREFDFSEVSYFVQQDPKTKSLTLFRRRDPTPDPEPFSGGNREEIARGIRGLRFEYYDGWDWYEEWGDPTGKRQTKLIPEPNMSGLPEAVRITFTIDPGFERKSLEEESKSPEPPLVFQTTARVNMSLFFYRRSSGGSTNSASATPSSGGNPAGPPGGGGQ